MVTVHFVRHAEGYHNVEGPVELSGGTLLRLLRGGWRRLTIRLMLRVVQQLLWHLGFTSSKPAPHADASLTALGWQQVAELRKRMKESGLHNRVELVVVSPLTRTLQTAAGLFGGETYNEGVEALPALMAEGVGQCPHPAISSPQTPPLVALEVCREHFGVHVSGRRGSIKDYKLQFPGVDFSQIEDDEDTLWKPDAFESEEDASARCRAFVEWLLNRKEKEIAVVSHCGFLARLFHQIGDRSCSLFRNCELRTVVLDRAKLLERS